MRGHGELAVASAGQLYLLGGAVAQLTPVSLPSRATDPAWSPDHHWLAVMSGHRLYVLRASGHDARPLTPEGRTVSDAVWSPTRDALAVTSYLTKHSASPHYRVDLFRVQGGSSRLATGTFISGAVWSPDGNAIAIAAPKHRHHGPERLGWQGRIVVVDVAAHSTRVITRRRGAVLKIAGWTPDGSQILYWPDPMGSASIAADGLPLMTAPAHGGPSVQIIKTQLTHPAWIAYAPDGRSVATVDGGLREVWGGHKHIVTCGGVAGCTPVPQPRHDVSLWPTWTPDGTRIVFARLPTRRSSAFRRRDVAQWTRSGRLLVAAPGQPPQPLGGIPRGATAPVYSADGTLLFATARWIWLKPAGSPARRVMGPLAGLRVSPYFGYVPYREIVAWSAARPDGYAGTS